MCIQAFRSFVIIIIFSAAQFGFERVIFPQLLVRRVEARQAAAALSWVLTCFRVGGGEGTGI